MKGKGTLEHRREIWDPMKKGNGNRGLCAAILHKTNTDAIKRVSWTLYTLHIKQTTWSPITFRG